MIDQQAMGGLTCAAGHIPSDTREPDAGRNARDAQKPNAGQCRPDPQSRNAGHVSADAHSCRAGHPSSEAHRFVAGTGGVEGARSGQASPDARSANADLALLHAALGHYARQLWDIQKTRIMMGNRVAAMERDGFPEEFIAHARSMMERLAQMEADLDRYLARQAKRHFMADWIAEQRGIGLPGFARLLGITGPLERFETVSKLWAYLGMHVVDGAAPKRQKGETANWSAQGRVLCHQIGDSIVKVGGSGPYRAAYDRKKGEYETDRPDWTQARRHNAAMRYAVKMLLKEMWIEWRRRRPTHP